MRRVVIGGLLIGLLALAWYVDSLLARTLWVNNFVAETRSGDWYTGWPILWHAWPLALVGILVGGSFALLGVGLVYGWANEGDQEREMERLRQVAIEAEQRAEQAEATALINATTALQQEQAVLQAQQVEADARNTLSGLVYQTVIPRNVRISEAPSHGKPVLLYDFKSTGSQAYLRLASEIIQREKRLRAA